MLIFNTTYLVSDKMYGQWFKWLQEEHIPSMLDSGLFSQPQIAKVLTADTEQEGTSYSVQFHTPDMPSLEAWNYKHGEEFMNGFNRLFGHEVPLFCSILEVVE